MCQAKEQSWISLNPGARLKERVAKVFVTTHLCFRSGLLLGSLGFRSGLLLGSLRLIGSLFLGSLGFRSSLLLGLFGFLG